MKGIRLGTFAIIGSVLAGTLLMASAATGAAAAVLPELRARVEAAGYVFKLAGPANYAKLNVEGKVIAVEKGGAQARVELFEYAREAQLREDWLAVNGESPRPRQAGDEFKGRVAYWNQDSVLVVDFRAPNDAATAQYVGDAFLGRTGDVPPASVVSGEETAAPVTPPRVGDGDLLASEERGVPSWLQVVLVTGGLGGIALVQVKRYRRRSAGAAAR